ncbi:MAG: DUF559 domain-containing protein, partial [Chitinophagaceae bacterium]|nr:DUF559 domain-containing protein [Chitinophagaceae bacterium]
KNPSDGEFYEDADPGLYPLLKEYCLKHRSNPTKAEGLLWEGLRGKQLENYKFRRQHIIGAYIADFVCLAKKLIVEVDGLIHELPEHKIADAQRTTILEEKGFTVFRVTNDDVIHHYPETLNRILHQLNSMPFAERKTYAQDSFPVGEGRDGAPDYIGGFAVSIHGIEPHLQAFIAAHDDYNKILLQAVADRLAEAFAEVLHLRVRKEFWGYAADEQIPLADLVKEQYRGIRPAPGYPACPDHTEKIKLFELLNATQDAGIQLTESLAMYPAASVCGWYFSHPQSSYFGIGKILPDQLEDYAARKQMSIEAVTKWLSPNLDE